MLIFSRKVLKDRGKADTMSASADPENQGKGYGKALIDFLASKYADEYSVLQVGTGDSPLTIHFMKNVDLLVLTRFPISLLTIMTTQFMRAVYS